MKLRWEPLASVLVLVLLWAAAVNITEAPSHLFPSPWRVAVRLADGLLGAGDFWPHLAATLKSAAMGYVLAALVAGALALLMAEFAWVERLYQLPLSALQAVPKVALAPLVLLWAGYNQRSVVVLVAMVCFFPLFTATLSGLRSTSASLLDLYRVCGATRWRRLWDLGLPSAAPQVFAGLMLAVGFSIIGAVVMEFILGTEGVGFLIENSANTLDAPTAVAAMLAISGCGALVAAGMRGLERRTLVWRAQA